MGTGKSRPFTATMTTPSPGVPLTISDLLCALDAAISEEISLARSAPRSHNSSPPPMVSPLVVISFSRLRPLAHQNFVGG